MLWAEGLLFFRDMKWKTDSMGMVWDGRAKRYVGDNNDGGSNDSLRIYWEEMVSPGFSQNITKRVPDGLCNEIKGYGFSHDNKRKVTYSHVMKRKGFRF